MENNKGRWYFLNPNTKSLKLNIKVPYAEMLEEAKALRDRFIPYRTMDDYAHQGWHSLPIYGLQDRPLCWTAYEEYKTARDASNDYDWTEESKLCPVTVDWLKNVFPSNKYGRVRFMLVEAGGWIAPHSDTDIPIVETVNVALSNHPDCVWHWGDGTELHYKPGDAYALNIAPVHEVRNNSNEDRYHIIVHHHDSTEAWINMMKEAFKEQNETYDMQYSEELY